MDFLCPGELAGTLRPSEMQTSWRIKDQVHTSVSVATGTRDTLEFTYPGQTMAYTQSLPPKWCLGCDLQNKNLKNPTNNFEKIIEGHYILVICIECLWGLLLPFFPPKPFYVKSAIYRPTYFDLIFTLIGVIVEWMAALKFSTFYLMLPILVGVSLFVNVQLRWSANQEFCVVL